MKTILYNPIFINPQAYYVFPRLTRWLHPDNGYKEPANYIGQIEVTIIAYGEIGYTEYFEHTNYIDFTNFSNSYVRISLFTRLGSCVLGEWKIGAMESDRPYIEPEVLASLKAVVIVGDKTNQDKDRDTVANLVDASNPFVISNASYNLNSGYGLYAYDFTKWGLTKPPTTCIREADKFTLTYVGTKVGKGLCIIETTNTSTSTIHVSFKVKISGIQDDTEGYFSNADNQHILLTNGINSIEMDVLTGHWYGFNFVKKDGSILGNCNIVVEQIPEFQGAFVTDGVNDTIISTKTVAEMGITDEVTVVSMIHQITLNTKYNIATTNYIENSDTKEHVRTDAYVAGKTGIYGYTASLINSTRSTIGYILGDIRDYQAVGTTNKQTILDSKFSVEGRVGGFGEVSSVAWYWTIIANKVLTTDQINQVIAYFNLDRTLKPDILCNVKKQGITNENHAEFGDKLIDFSGNGRDIQLNNIAWKGDSGIGKYATDFTSWTTPKEVQKTSDTVKITTEYTEHWVAYLAPNNTFKSMKVLISGIPDGGALQFFRTTADGGGIKMVNGINEIPEFTNTVIAGFYIDVPLGFDWSNLVIEQIPSHAGALCLDGVNDFGKVTGMPIYKDYTFIIDYERISYASSEKWVAGVVSKSHVANQGAFILMTANTKVELGKQTYSFGGVTSFNRDDFTRALVYQSKYKCGDVDLTVGEGVDSNTLWLGTFRDNDQRFFNGAIYSLMSFPYSMSEFLIERQLKKHKLGTLYPDMVEFRPIVKSNVKWNIIEIWQGDKSLYRPAVNDDKTGIYLKKDSTIGIYVKPKDADEVTKIVVNGTEYTNLKINSNGFYYVTLPITKSPQKINITIDEYIRFEDIVQPYPSLFTLTPQRI